MSRKTQWKLLGWVLVFFLMVSWLDWLHISVELVVWSLLLAGLVVILTLPKWFLMLLRDLVTLPRKDGKPREAWDRGWRFVLFEIVIIMHDRFWGFVTRYYPFSLLYADRLFHAGNQDVRSFIHELEAYAKDQHLPFLIQSGDIGSPMMMLRAVQRGRKRKKADYLAELTEKLQGKYESIYLQDKADGFTILVPTSIVRG